MTMQHHSRPDDHLRCRSCHHVWRDDVDRERCCDPAWRRVLIAAYEWETLGGIEYAGPSAVAGLDFAWQRRHDAAA
jgi:hypothetical protein